MKNVTFIGQNDCFSEVKNKLIEFYQDKLDVNCIEVLDKENLNTDTLYVLSVKDIKDLEETKHHNFIVVTENLGCSKYSILTGECYKNGILECVINPESSTMIFIKIKRFLTDHKYEFDKEEVIKLKMNDIVRRDIKGSRRGNYDYTLVGIRIESTSKKDIKEAKALLTLNIRETDTLATFSENILLVSMPFCDKDGAVIVKEKLNNLISVKLGYKIHLVSTTLNSDAKTEWDLINLISSELTNNYKDLELACHA